MRHMTWMAGVAGIGLGLSLLTASAAMAWERRYNIETGPSTFGTEREIEMRPRFGSGDPLDRYRGTIDTQTGDTRMRNLNGDTLRGTIESDGYGRLRDQSGNMYRVRPR
jgi:hypothetical protein